MTTWKDQINKLLVEAYYESEGFLCVECVHQRVPGLTLADVLRTLESMGSDGRYYVSSFTARCSRCGEDKVVYACD